MKLSIIIVNYKAWQHIEKAMCALEADFGDDWEVIIVDNETEPRSLERFARDWPWVKLVPNSANSGFGFGSAIGVSHATGDQLLFMNPDVIASSEAIRALIAEKAAYPDVAIIAPRQVGSDGQPQKVFDEFPGLLNQNKSLKFLRRLINPARSPAPRREYRELVYCDWVTGSFLLMDRADYEAVGGWSTDYWMYGEDADLCKRASVLGLRSAYTPKVEVVHTHGGSSHINVPIRALTKLEVIISKHVYAGNHAKGLKRPFTQLAIVVWKVPPLLLGAVADLLTLRRIPALRVRSCVLLGLLAYYRRVVSTGCWLSPRARLNKPAQP